MAVNCKKIRERVTKMNTAWAQSAPTVAFKGITQTAFQAKIQAAAAVDQQYADLLASFLKSKEQRIRNALVANDLATARKLVNGGSHGLPDFEDAFNTGKTLLA